MSTRMNDYGNKRSLRIFLVFTLIVGALAAAAGIIVGCSSGTSGNTATGMATATVHLSDPSTCTSPNGPFSHVYVTISDVQAHTSASAGPNDAGWVDLTPKLSQSPQQVDLLGPVVSQCFLANMGDSLELQAGNYQQIRVILSTTVPAGQGKGIGGTDACGSQANCVVLADNSIHTLVLSSEAKTGLKIPSGQIANGGFNIAAGQTKDLDIDFDTCDSIVQESNGDYRLKPVLHAGEVSTTSTSINGVVVDNATGKPLDGIVEVALEQKDANGVDRIFMSTVAGFDGSFVFCPLPAGTYDVVIVGRSSAGVVYSPTVVTGVAPGQTVSIVSLHALTGVSAAPADLHGMVTSQNGATPPAGTGIHVQLSTLEAVSSTLTVTVPLVPGLSGIELSLATSSSTSCPTGTDCVSYDLKTSGGPAFVGAYSAGSIALTQSTLPVSYVVDAIATVPASGGTLDCSPSELKSAPLTPVAGTTVSVPTQAFAGCQ
jgi:hypothetical protein